uniref:Uncharacterized protein n=1 Tax=Molossus molossus TaxID=27622 RepID=A0A7J8BBZ4_MOLMO|nr:hypothetical protein HJG59_010471 [Molossus molossus]
MCPWLVALMRTPQDLICGSRMRPPAPIPYHLIKQTLKTMEGARSGQVAASWREELGLEAMASALQWGGMWGSENPPCWTPPPPCLTLGGWGLIPLSPSTLAPGLFHLVPQKEEAPVPCLAQGPTAGSQVLCPSVGLSTTTQPRPHRISPPRVLAQQGAVSPLSKDRSSKKRLHLSAGKELSQ